MTDFNHEDYELFLEKMFGFMTQHFLPIDIDKVLFFKIPKNERVLSSFLVGGRYVKTSRNSSKTYSWNSMFLITKNGLCFRNHEKVPLFRYWNEIPSKKFIEDKIHMFGYVFHVLYETRFYSKEISYEIANYIGKLCDVLNKNFSIFLKNMKKYSKDRNLLEIELIKRPFDTLLNDCCTYYLVKNKMRALELFNNLLKLTLDIEKKIMVLFSIAFCFKESREYNKTIEIFDKILELDPNNVKAKQNKIFTQYARFYYELNPNHRKKAKKVQIKALNKVISARKYQIAGQQQEAQNGYTTALNLFEKALQKKFI